MEYQSSPEKLISPSDLNSRKSCYSDFVHFCSLNEERNFNNYSCLWFTRPWAGDNIINRSKGIPEICIWYHRRVKGVATMIQWVESWKTELPWKLKQLWSFLWLLRPRRCVGTAHFFLGDGLLCTGLVIRVNRRFKSYSSNHERAYDFLHATNFRLFIAHRYLKT